MSEEKGSEIVTTEKPKNPGRVEWGKKLGKISKERKLKREQEQIAQNSQETVKQISSHPQSIDIAKITRYWIYIVGGSVGLIGFGLYWFKKSKPVVVNNRIIEKQKPKFSDF